MDRTDRQKPILSDRVIVNGTVTPVSLFSDGTLWCLDGGQRCLTLEKEVLGFVTAGPNIVIKTIVENRKRGSLVRNDVVFQSLSEESQRLWCQNLREYIDSLGRPKRLFVFLNPFGGKKAATTIFDNEVKPLLEDAEIQITLQGSDFSRTYDYCSLPGPAIGHQLHAKEVAHALDVSKYDGIICVSGDGILVEVVNGLLDREDWDTAIKIPLGVIPAGTGNGMAKSLLDSVGHPCKAVNAVLSIIRGHKRSLDVATIRQGKTRFFSVLMLAWGLIADIDIESEKYRWMGSARLEFYALNRIVRLRQYTGCISFVPAPGFEAFGEPTGYPGESTHRNDNVYSNEVQAFKLQKCCYQGPDIDLKNLNWRVINGPFISIWLHNVPWGAEDTMPAPDAKFSDGCLDLIIIKNCPKLSLLSMMIELNNGSYVKSPYVMYLKVKAFILEPGPRVSKPKKEGIIDVDGEVLARGKGTYNCDQKALMAYDKLQITLDQGLATIFTPI